MCLVFNMNTFKAVQCATIIIFIITLLTASCYSRNAENNVQLIFSGRKNVQFVKKLQPDIKVQQNNNKLWDLDNPLDILEEKDVSNQQGPPRSTYFKTGGDNNSRDIIKKRVSRQINNGYSSIYPSLTAFNQNVHNMYPTPYNTPGSQFNRSSIPPTYPYNYPSNVNYNYPSNQNRYPQNSTFQASVPSINFSSKPYYPYGQNVLPNNFTNPNYIQNNWHNQSSVQNPNRYNHYNNSHNYPGYSNTNNFNSGYIQPNYNQFYGLPGQTNNANLYNTPNVYNFTNAPRNNPIYNSARAMNGSFYPHPFGSSNFSFPTYPQNNYFTYNKNLFNNSVGGTTSSRPYQNNVAYFNQSSYTQTTPMSTPYFRPNPISQNNFGGPNQSYRTEPNHFFYTPGGNNLNGTVNYNLPHKYYK